MSIGLRHVAAASDRLFACWLVFACGESHDLRAFVENSPGVFLPQRSLSVLALCMGASASAYMADNRRTNCAPYTNDCLSDNFRPS